MAPVGIGGAGITTGPVGVPVTAAGGAVGVGLEEVVVQLAARIMAARATIQDKAFI